MFTVTRACHVVPSGAIASSFHQRPAYWCPSGRRPCVGPRATPRGKFRGFTPVSPAGPAREPGARETVACESRDRQPPEPAWFSDALHSTGRSVSSDVQPNLPPRPVPCPGPACHGYRPARRRSSRMLRPSAASRSRTRARRPRHGWVGDRSAAARCRRPQPYRYDVLAACRGRSQPARRPGGMGRRNRDAAAPGERARAAGRQSTAVAA
jgi:hypothetical protein